jgi:UDP-N-acetylmuramate dehydrogenase
VVAGTVDAGLGGLECLSGIPGLVGATPVQNVGAYGVEVAQLLISVDLLDRASGAVRTLRADELGLGYRTSVLKNTDRAVVLRVRFALTDGGMSAPVRYTELARALGVRQGTRVPVADARAAVLSLRRGKGMVLDPTDHDTWSAGSFFTNPIVPDAELPAVLARIAARVGAVPIPQYPAGQGASKLSAAWLIERAGFDKGYPAGRPRHPVGQTHPGADQPRRRHRRRPPRPRPRSPRRRPHRVRHHPAPRTGPGRLRTLRRVTPGGRGWRSTGRVA